MRAICAPGDHVVFPDDAYGGTFRLFNKVLGALGVEMTPAAVTDPAAIRAAIRPGKTKVVWLETPTNPLLNVADIASSRRSRTTPVPCWSSTTRSRRRTCSSRSSSVPTSSCTRPRSTWAGTRTWSAVRWSSGDAELAEKIAFHQNAIGAVAGPFDSWLVLRGIKTLGVRMDRHSDNAEQVVEFLQRHKSVTQVLYPGIDGHPGHETAAKQMQRFGGIVSFRVAGGEQQAIDICNKAEVFTLGESLGGVESLIEHPGKMTHASVAGTPLEVPADLIRLSASASRRSTTCSRTSTTRWREPWASWLRSTSGRRSRRRSRWTPVGRAWSPGPSTAPRSAPT